jgi:hypothetical protein
MIMNAMVMPRRMSSERMRFVGAATELVIWAFILQIRERFVLA